MSDLYSKVCGCISHSGFLTRAGYRAVDAAAKSSEIDSRVSVSGLRRDETHMIFDEELLDEQHRRFLDAVEVR